MRQCLCVICNDCSCKRVSKQGSVFVLFIMIVAVRGSVNEAVSLCYL